MNPYTRTLEPAWRNQNYVSINEKALVAFAEKLLEENKFHVPNWRFDVFPEEDNGAFVQFIGVLNALNYCFIDFETGKKFDVEYPRESGSVLRGSFALTASLKRALEEGVPILDAKYLAQITKTDAEKIFEPVTTPIPFLALRVEWLQGVGKQLLEDYNGSFVTLFVKANYRLFDNGGGIVERLTNEFLSYGDHGNFMCKIIYFAKRAQLLPMMYYGRQLDSNGALPPIRDPENFGPIADYVNPNVLRHHGVLEYAEPLALKVDTGEILLPCRPKEMAIRSTCTYAMLRLLFEINVRMPSVKEHIGHPELDSAVWSLGPTSKKYQYHRTPTAAY